jgi:hypothetical protein
MNPRGLLFTAVAIVVVTAFSTAIATAQNTAQESESRDLVVPNNADTFDTGNTQSSTFIPGETDTNSKHQTINPRPKKPREKRESNNKDGATPTEATPTKAALGSGLSSSSGGSLKELPRTGGPGA